VIFAANIFTISRTKMRDAKMPYMMLKRDRSNAVNSDTEKNLPLFVVAVDAGAGFLEALYGGCVA
jgi:hypothetical protein